MKDLYLKTTSYEALVSFLADISVFVTDLSGIESITHPYIMEGHYFQNEEFIIDWIGKVPQTINEETGEVLTWFTQHRFNVRLIDESVTLFDSFTSVFPETPYRKFS